MDFSQYSFDAGTPIVAVAQCQNDTGEREPPNERFVSRLRVLAWSLIRGLGQQGTSRSGDLKSPTEKEGD
jgi:hypothetical protein